MNRNSIIIALGLFVVGYGTNVSTPFLVLYRDRLGLSANQTQLIFVVYVTGILLTLLIAGQLSDRVGRKPLLIASLALSAVGSLILIFGRDSYALLIVGRIVLGIVSGAGLGVGAAWLQEVMGRGNERRAATIATLVTYGGFGAAPPLSVLYEWLLPSPLVVPFVFHIVVTLAMIPIVVSVDETVDVSAAARQGRWRPSVQLGIPPEARRSFGWYVAPLAILVFAFPSMAFALFPVVLSDQVDASAVVLTGLSGTCTAWGGLLSRPLIERMSAKTAMSWGAAIGTVGYAIGTIAIVTSTWQLAWPAAIVLGAASGVLSIGGLTIVGEITDDENRGALSSTFFLLAYVGMTMPLIVSALGGSFGTTPVLIGLVIVAASLTATAPVRQRIGAATSR